MGLRVRTNGEEQLFLVPKGGTDVIITVEGSEDAAEVNVVDTLTTIRLKNYGMQAIHADVDVEV